MVSFLRNFGMIFLLGSFLCLHSMEEEAMLRDVTIFEAITSRDIPLIKSLLPSVPKSYGLALLFHAIQQSIPDETDLKILTILLQHGINPNNAGTLGITPLMAAAKKGLPSIVSLLIQYHADLNTQDESGKTALHHAVLNNHEDVVKALLKHHAQVNTQDNDGATPLFDAIKPPNNIHIVSDLLNAQADPNLADNDKVTPLHQAAQYGEYDIAALLIDKHANLNAQDKFGETPLHLATLYEHCMLESLLLHHGAGTDPNIASKTTPLHEAAAKGYSEQVDLLVKSGASVNVRDKNSFTPLHNAIYANDEKSVQILLQHGAQVNVQDSRGHTPLHEAAIKRNVRIATDLLQAHADPNMQDENGDTPLHIAARNGFTELVELLLNNKANPAITNKNRLTALENTQRQIQLLPVDSEKIKALTAIMAALEIVAKGMPLTQPIYTPPTTQPAPGSVPTEVPVPTGKQVVAAKEALQNAPVPRSKAQLLKGALIGLGALATTYGLYYYLTLQVPTNLTPTELETQIVMALQNKNYDYANKLADSNPQAVAGLSPQQRQELEQVIDTTIIQASREAAKTAGTYNLLGYFQPPLPEQLRLLHHLAHTIERGQR